MKNDTSRILLFNLGGIGDLLVCQPALRALRRKYPDALIDIAVAPRCFELVRSYGFFNSVFAFSAKASSIGLCLKLRRNSYDFAVNMRSIASWQSMMKMFFIFKIINPRVSIGRDTSSRGFFFDLKVAESEPSKRYAMEYDIELVGLLGADVPDRRIDFAVSHEARSKLAGYLREQGVGDDERVVVIHPGGMASRRWPVENFIRVCQQLQQRRKSVFVVTGSKEESVLARVLVREINGKCVDLTAKLDLEELAALLERCSLFISNDTGPMHLAAVLGIEQIAVFGPGDLAQFDPRVINPKAVVFYKKVTGCAPCNRPRCSSLACLKAVEPGEVVQAAADILDRDKGAKR